MLKNQEPKLHRRGITALATTALLGLLAGGCSANSANDPPTAKEFSVKSFRYDRVADVGYIAASQSFAKPVSEQAAILAMETILENSDFEFKVFFPDVPEPVANGSMKCHLDTLVPATNSFQYTCIATPARHIRLA